MTEIIQDLEIQLSNFGYSYEAGYTSTKTISTVKPLKIDCLPNAKLYLYIQAIDNDTIEIQLSTLYCLYNEIQLTQIVTGDDAKNSNYIYKLIKRMENQLLGKFLNTVTGIAADLNYLKNYICNE